MKKRVRKSPNEDSGLTIPVVVGRSEQLSCLTCVNGNKETKESKCLRCLEYSKHQTT